MQLCSLQSKLIWLLLPVLAIAALPSLSGATTIGTGPLNLLTPSNLTANRAAYCKHGDDPDPYDPGDDPYGPGHYTSSLNYTFPNTPPLSQSFLNSVGFNESQGSWPFDCFFELPGGVVVFEIKGEIDANLRLAFEVWLSVLMFNYEIGVYSCELLDLDKDPCAFNINTRYFHGQGGVYPQDDKDPAYVDLCLKIHGEFKIPYTRTTKTVNYDHCFTRFPRKEDPGKPTLGTTLA